MFGPKITTMIADFNKQHPQYDFPDKTWDKLYNMVEKSLQEEIANPKSPVLQDMFLALQNNVETFLGFLENPSRIYTKSLADICATLPERKEES